MIAFVSGLVIALVCWAFAMFNMFSGMNRKERTMLGILKGHLGAMFGMAIGSVISLIGLVNIIIDLVKTH